MQRKKEEKSHSLKKFSIEEHLWELKSRVIKIVIFFMVSTVVTFQFAWDIFAVLSKPLVILIGTGEFHFIYTKLTEGFITELKISFIFAIFLTLPFFFFQFYKFVAPGLYKQEKVIVAPYLIFSPILFMMGAFLVYFVVMPITWRFFASFQNLNYLSGTPIKLEAKISEYLDLVIELFISFGIAFQLPIVLVMLTKLKIITISQLVKFRRYSIVLIFILAAILTPPDVLSQIILALPLMLLYEISILCCKKVNPK
ncbi:twin-arginine translocase subunit TatC [Candidatus Bandiella euplotis]|uniref:Sec-independent protein translocase protein TatC n=1 Tax=Candidatus Bandiella euplotis TaxID=1664265 RepID=A0ABZ0UL95_9RICK|nr:twin-arginine translocase subunit TatC [Candidatus Bandiella woodruffii]WPX96457.1 Sec-independent protein translocase protein TatC [Candidatus Bandiella woodruffii]